MNRKILLKVTLPVLVLGLGVVAFVAMVKLRKEPARVERPSLGILVQTIPVTLTDHKVVVSAFGTVMPKAEIEIIPQVAGRVIEVSPSLVQGGFVSEGDVLLRIDPRDYELAVARAQADVARAEFELAREQQEGEIAREEWELLNRDNAAGGEERPSEESLLFRGPQSKVAEANRDAADARLKEARLALERTVIRAPFNARVRAESVDEGQYVSPGKVVAVIYGTDSAEIRFPVPDEELGWFHVSDRPDAGGRKPADVLVHATYGGRDHEWKARVVRTGGSIDTGSRLVDVIVEVRDPYDLRGAHAAADAPLTVGMFVEGRIQGETIGPVATIPRHSLRDGDTVWVFRDAGELEIRNVTVTRLTQNAAVIREGLRDGEQVIVSRIDAVTDGMKVRRVQEGS